MTLWQKAVRSATVWFIAVSAALFGWVWFGPSAVLMAWTVLPPDVRPMFPQSLLAIIGAVLFALLIAMRLRPKSGRYYQGW